MGKVKGRDFFNAPGRRNAESRLIEGEKLLEAFTRKVYAHEGVDESAGTESPSDADE